jgi:prefoldin alpha subunit
MEKKVEIKDTKKSTQEYLDSMVRMKYMEQQAGSIERQTALLQNAISEAELTISTLNLMKKQTTTSNSLFPLGTGVFAEGTLKKADNILVDVGAGVMVEKSMDEAIKFIDEKGETLKRNLSEYQTILANMQQSYQQAGNKIQELQKGGQ